MIDRTFLTHRLYVLGAILGLVLCCYLGVLYQTQVIEGDAYREQSVRTIPVRERVEASRGIITDRNGQEVVANRPAYNLTFDASLLSGEESEAEAILSLLTLCRAQSVPWTDNLPLSRTTPVAYALQNVSNIQKNRFLKFLRSLDDLTVIISEDWTAEDVTAESLPKMGLPADRLFDVMRDALSIPETFSNAEARDVLGVEYELAIRKLINTTAYTLTEDISPALIARITDGDYPGAKFTSASIREYRTESAAHILGSVGRIYEEEYAELKEKGYAMDDFVGKSGVELAFEDYLHGTDGTRIVSTNSEGKITSELYAVEPKPGSTVELTLDLPLQQVAETALAETVSNMTHEDGITRGAGVAVIEVGTGDILALASYPTYNLATYNQDYNKLKDDPANPLFNRATQGTYPPGSTFKPCTATAALETGIIEPNTRILTKGIYTKYAPSYQPRCWVYSGYGRTHGKINVSQAITHSCNYFFYHVGDRLGITKLDEYATAFGLGQHTGIEIGDAKGVLAGPAYAESIGTRWYDGQTIAAAIGQSYNLFTPLQLSNYIATLVNGGKHFDAHLLKAVKSYDNSEVVYQADDTPHNNLELQSSTMDAVKSGMHALTTGSLARYFNQCVVDAGAKTGTAQIGTNIKDNGVFVCFAPYDNPKIALGMVIEKGGSGSAIASTAVQIINQYFSSDSEQTPIGEHQLLP